MIKLFLHQTKKQNQWADCEQGLHLKNKQQHGTVFLFRVLVPLSWFKKNKNDPTIIVWHRNKDDTLRNQEKYIYIFIFHKASAWSHFSEACQNPTKTGRGFFLSSRFYGCMDFRSTGGRREKKKKETKNNMMMACWGKRGRFILWEEESTKKGEKAKPLC